MCTFLRKEEVRAAERKDGRLPVSEGSVKQLLRRVEKRKDLGRTMCWEVHGPEFKETLQCGCEPFSGHVSLHRWVQNEEKAGSKKGEFLFIFNLLLPHFTFWGDQLEIWIFI